MFDMGIVSIDEMMDFNTLQQYITLERHMLSMLPFFVACGSTQTELPTALENSESQVPDHTQNTSDPIQTTIRQLSVYDGTITCDKLPSQNRQETLTHIVDNVGLPPWAPMRAATCLTKLYPEEAQEDLIRWVENPQTKGLAFLLTKQIQTLPTPVAKRVASAGLKGPFAEEFRSRLIKQNDVRLTDILQQP